MEDHISKAVMIAVSIGLVGGLMAFLLKAIPIAFKLGEFAIKIFFWRYF